ncbi:MAG: DUF1549 domain-containing protein, partial [Candidatus Saccharimonas sp.]|nr:DUF1549 domain-containing protein [Planctomycetaceae bacterium]
MTTRSRSLQIVLTIAWLGAVTVDAVAANKRTPGKSGSVEIPTANAVAADVDKLILTDLEKAAVKPSGRCNDEDFLRRASLDITGQLPSPRDVTLFVLDPDAAKRTKLIERLLASPEFGKNWARYWRDVIYMPATEPRARLAQAEFETWMADQWNKGIGWNFTATAMLTALGDVTEHPETALIFAQSAETEDVAAEACRIFLGIQMQCANCHDHPSDIWKREQFHELAAYFPRIARRQMQTQPIQFEIASVNTDRGRGDMMRENPEQWVSMLDRNKDNKITKEEMKGGPGMMGRGPMFPAQVIDRIFEQADSNKDEKLTVAEIKAMPQPAQQRRGSTEHHMPDLKDPSSKGKLVQPKFFIDGSSPGQGLSDLERRNAAAKAFTSPDNPWFARAIVNRVWCEMLGEGFYMPVDDMGPSRSARFPEALEVICEGFVANAHDPKWLIRTVANSQTYQRKVAAKATAEDALPFASVTPTRLRADVVFNSLMQVLGIDEQSSSGGRGMMDGGPRAYQRSPRFGFNALFGIDPSVPKEDITGNVPQSLFLMNSNQLRGALTGSGNSRLGRILRDNKDDRDALSELYLLVLSREPSKHEVEICTDYLKEVTPRNE